MLMFFVTYCQKSPWDEVQGRTVASFEHLEEVKDSLDPLSPLSPDIHGKESRERPN